MRRNLHFFVLTGIASLALACSSNTSPRGGDGNGGGGGGNGAGPTIDNFSASETTVSLNGTVQLSWRVTGATSLKIEATPGGTILETQDQFEGMLTTAQLGANTTFTLSATNQDGTRMQSVTVSVNQPMGLAILSFEADPNPTFVNGTTILRWRTQDADRIRIAEGVKELLAGGEMAAQGMLTVQLENDVTSVTYTLEAFSGGEMRSQNVTVTAELPPVINFFGLTPSSFNQASATISVTWNTENATQLTLTANGTAVPEFTGAATGTITVTVTDTTRFVLTARSGGGEVESSQTAAKTEGEVEPNNDFMTATPIAGGGADGMIEMDDQDWYSVQVAAGGNIFAETSDGNGGCAFDTLITIYGPDGTTEITENDDRGDLCSRVDPEQDASARDLPAGTYYIRVTGFSGETGAYTLATIVGTADCGNGFIETLNSEVCDDGNMADGDGCSSSCQFEIAGTVSGVGSTMTFMGAIDPAGRVDIYNVEVDQPGYIRAETFIAVKPDCMSGGGDTIIELYQGATRLGSDDDDGTGLCSRIDPTSDMFAAVMPGTYSLRVRGLGGRTVIPAYSVEISILGQGCGNGIIEGMETCDDGNMADNDGCSAACAFEGPAEAEPNNDFMTATAFMSGTTVTGSIDPADDLDYYSIVVPEGHHIRATIAEDSMGGCNPGTRPRLRLFGTDGTTELVSNGTGGPGGRCGAIDPRGDAANLTAGTYFVSVAEGTNVVPRYFLTIETVMPECGNGIEEPNEQCEDGNVMPGDGCSATCTLEIAQTLSASGQVTLNLPNPDAFQIVQIDITTPGTSITATTSDGMGGCMVETEIELRDSMQMRLGGRAFAANGCPGIRFPADTWARDLTAGTYFIVVSPGSQTTGPVTLDVGILAPMCGNRVLEMNANEICDDGNTVSGDGCSATCQFEGTLTREMEPNDTQATAQASGATAAQSAIMTGAISPAMDQDWYSFDVPMGQTATLVASVYANVGSPTTCNNDPIMTLFDSAMMQIAEDDDDGPVLCPQLDPQTDMGVVNLAAGTYYLRVQSFMNRAEVSGYALEIELQ